MHPDKRSFRPLTRDEVREFGFRDQVKRGDQVYAVRPVFSKGQIIEFEGVAWRVVHIGNKPFNRLVLKPIGAIEREPSSDPVATAAPAEREVKDDLLRKV